MSAIQMLYNSDSFVVVEVQWDEAGGMPGAESSPQGGYEIVDKLARKGIFLDGAIAQSFRQAVSELVRREPSEEEFDEFIAGYTALAQQPVVLH